MRVLLRFISEVLIVMCNLPNRGHLPCTRVYEGDVFSIGVLDQMP